MAKKGSSPGRGGLGRRLSINEIAKLGRLLDERPAGIGGIEALDGFLLAVIAGPDLVPPSEVMATVLQSTTSPSIRWPRPGSCPA